MDYFARRNLYNNNRTPPILLNNGSYNKQFSKTNMSRIIPSYSGNPHILRNYKTKINISSSNNNNYSTNKKTNGINNYSKYQRYIKPSNNINNNKNKSGIINNYNRNYFSPNRLTKNENHISGIQPANLRSKILNLSQKNQNKTISKNFSMEYLPIKNNFRFSSSKKKLILDLDETLVHSGFNPFTRQSDISIQINIDGKIHTINILKRPHVDEFLKEIANYFEIYVFTASMEEYASPVIDLIDKNRVLKGKFFRQDCIFNNGLYIKDLFKVTNDLKDVIIIDNNPSSYFNNEDNGIPIKTWYDDLNDNELIKLIPVLKYLSTVNDVRNIIRQIVDRRNNEVDFNVVNRIMNSNNYDNNNKNYENNFYYEINESKSKGKNNTLYGNISYYSKYDRYAKYNNINSFSNMSYNEIQNEEEHVNNNNNINISNINNNKYYNNYINNNEEMKYNQRNKNYGEDLYQQRNDNENNNNVYFYETAYFERQKNNIRNRLYNQSQESQNKINDSQTNFIYEEKKKNNRAFTPNLNRRKVNSFFANENDVYDDSYLNGNNKYNIYNQNNEREKIIGSYYDKTAYNQNMVGNTYNNLYYKNNLKINTQNILNKSSSDIFSKIQRNDANLTRYNYLLNKNDNDNGNDNDEENGQNESNEINKDYYLQSYKRHLSRTNYRSKNYNKNIHNNSINVIKQNNTNIRINNPTVLNNSNQSKNYLEYFSNKNSNININKPKNEEKYERYNNYISQNYNNNSRNNKRDYFDEINQFKEQINTRFNNFRDYIRDKRKEITREENKSLNYEQPGNSRTKMESYGQNNYYMKNNINNYSNNNYLERTNLQNLIDQYKNKYSTFENSIYNINNKAKMNQTFSIDKKYLNE